MFVKLTRSGGRRYLQLVESYRNDAGQPRQRTVATVGRLDEAGGAVDTLIDRLLGATGRSAGAAVSASPPSADDIRFDASLAYGDAFVLDALWRELGFDAIGPLLRSAHPGFDAEALVRAMVFNRLCDATSKLGLLRWLEVAWVPGLDAASVTHQRLLRTMDSLEHKAEQVSALVARLLRPLIDTQLSVVFYDLTTLRAEGATDLPGDLRAVGLAKEGVFARQCLLGVVQTAEGLPLAHRLWQGNAAEATTLSTAVAEVLRLYPVQRLILVADRGLLNMDNLAMLRGLKVGAGGDARPLEYILAVPARRYNAFAQALASVQPACVVSADELTGEMPWPPKKADDGGSDSTSDGSAPIPAHDTLAGTPDSADHVAGDDAVADLPANSPTLHLVWAHNPQRAAEQTAQRRSRIAELLARAQASADKLDEQDGGKAFKGRKLSDAGAKARLHHEVLEAHLAHIVKVDLRHDQLSWSVNDERLAQAELLDGKLLLLTNVADLTPAEIVRRYKGLADIERGFHVLKSQIEIAPMFHRLPERIRAHGLICFLALVLHRVMRMRLKAKGHAASPERALQMLRQVQRHRIHLAGGTAVTGLSSISAAQADLFAALEVPRPTAAGL